MNVFWVLYRDGYCDNGDVGWASFQTRELAEGFVAKRLALSKEPDIGDYTVIEGRLLGLKTEQVAVKVKIV